MDRLTPSHEWEINRSRRQSRYDGPRPTIGQTRAAGHIGFAVICNGRPNSKPCHHTRSFRWEELPVQDAWAFVDIPRLLPFRCTACGSREFHIFPDWSHHKGPGMARPYPPDTP